MIEAYYDRAQLLSLRRSLLQKGSWVALAAVAAITLYILSFSLGSFWITFLAGCIGTCGTVFLYFLLLSPVAAEHRLLQNILLGKSETEQLTFLSEDGATLRENVPCRALRMQGTDERGRSYERAVYLESRIPMPSLIPGEMLELSTYQNIITALKRI